MNLDQEPQPTEKEWLELYRSAVEFRRLGCWNWMFDSDVFGVRDPESDEVGYCCVLGRLRQVIGLVVYRGAEGIDVHERIQAGRVGPGHPDLLHLQRCLMVSFESKADLEEQDRKQVEGLGFKGRGRRAFPQFRSYRPGYLPWTLSGGEARLLRLALDETMEMAVRLREKRNLLDAPREGHYLVRSRGASGWAERWEAPVQRQGIDVLRLPFDEVRVQRIKNRGLPRRGSWEADFFFAPAAVYDDERPYYPYLFLIVNGRRAKPVGMRLARTEEHVDAFRAEFLAVLEREKALPREVLVQSEQALELLEPLTVRLGIRLESVEILETLSYLRAGLAASLMSEPPAG
jgi:Domain of unknown function (DUF6930)